MIRDFIRGAKSYLTIGGIVFCLYYLSLFWFSNMFAISKAITMTLVYLGAYHVHRAYLIPSLLLNHPRYRYYFLSIAITLGMVMLVEVNSTKVLFFLIDGERLISEMLAYIEVAEFDSSFFLRVSYTGGRVVITLSVVILVGVISELHEYSVKREQQQMQLKQERVSAELKYLKAQINPHFLFNALSSLYTMSYMKMDGVPDRISKLSDMLRYLIYECDTETVSLHKEATYLRNYIDFESIKLDNPDQVEFDMNIANGDLQIEPNLLMTLLENAFKHGDVHTNDNGYIRVNLVESGGKLIFSVVNTYGPMMKKSQSHGIGLENMKKRLEINSHYMSELDINQKKDVYSVTLNLMLK